jgi:hypothetical protein
MNKLSLNSEVFIFKDANLEINSTRQTPTFGWLVRLSDAIHSHLAIKETLEHGHSV